MYFALFDMLVVRYGIILWGGNKRIVEVLKLQKKVIRILKKCNDRTSCGPIFIDMGILTVCNLYILDLLTFVHTRDSNILRSEYHGYQTRFNNQIHLPFFRLSKCQNSHLYFGPKLYNHLPESIKYLPSKCFKERLHKWLSLNPFYSYEFLNFKVIDICILILVFILCSFFHFTLYVLCIHI